MNLYRKQTAAGIAANSTTLSLRERLHLRVHELAVMAGRGECEINQSDYEQAKRDVTGEVDATRQNSLLDAGQDK